MSQDYRVRLHARELLDAHLLQRGRAIEQVDLELIRLKHALESVKQLRDTTQLKSVYEPQLAALHDQIRVQQASHPRYCHRLIDTDEARELLEDTCVRMSRASGGKKLLTQWMFTVALLHTQNQLGNSLNARDLARVLGTQMRSRNSYKVTDHTYVSSKQRGLNQQQTKLRVVQTIQGLVRAVLLSSADQMRSPDSTCPQSDLCAFVDGQAAQSTSLRLSWDRSVEHPPCGHSPTCMCGLLRSIVQLVESGTQAHGGHSDGAGVRLDVLCSDVEATIQQRQQDVPGARGSRDADGETSQSRFTPMLLDWWDYREGWHTKQGPTCRPPPRVRHSVCASSEPPAPSAAGHRHDCTPVRAAPSVPAQAPAHPIDLLRRPSEYASQGIIQRAVPEVPALAAHGIQLGDPKVQEALLQPETEGTLHEVALKYLPLLHEHSEVPLTTGRGALSYALDKMLSIACQRMCNESNMAESRGLQLVASLRALLLYLVDSLPAEFHEMRQSLPTLVQDNVRKLEPQVARMFHEQVQPFLDRCVYNHATDETEHSEGVHAARSGTEAVHAEKLDTAPAQKDSPRSVLRQIQRWTHANLPKTVSDLLRLRREDRVWHGLMHGPICLAATWCVTMLRHAAVRRASRATPFLSSGQREPAPKRRRKSSLLSMWSNESSYVDHRTHQDVANADVARRARDAEDMEALAAVVVELTRTKTRLLQWRTGLFERHPRAMTRILALCSVLECDPRRVFELELRGVDPLACERLLSYMSGSTSPLKQTSRPAFESSHRLTGAIDGIGGAPVSDQTVCKAATATGRTSSKGTGVCFGSTRTELWQPLIPLTSNKILSSLMHSG